MAGALLHLVAVHHAGEAEEDVAPDVVILVTRLVLKSVVSHPHMISLLYLTKANSVSSSEQSSYCGARWAELQLARAATYSCRRTANQR